jgi:hypothetical protein
MRNRLSFKKFVPLTLIGTVLTLFFVFLGAPFLRVIRNVYGSVAYWSAGALFVAFFGLLGLVPFAFLIGSTWLVIGIYGELEEAGYANFWTALFATSVGTAILVIGPMLWAQGLGLNMAEILGNGIEKFLSQLQSPDKGLMSGIKIDSKFIISQIPSVIFLIHMTSLGLALISDRKTAMMFGVRFERIAGQIRLLEFRAPDFLIWLMMLSFLFSFLKLANEQASIISMNVFNVAMGIYFFQGLAVLEVFLLAFKAGTFTRIIVYFVIIGQLFFLLSILGVIDYWVDFRKRLRKIGMKEKNQNNGEHV